ncbi:MAG: lipid-A-disaccharide synthase N-terminal domain-containing protein [Phycisphaerales bacterium]|nr:lipid-A-disaccharide synthase N-terminal domain-containing protein [Phycisphaerales bacterium]
MKPGPILAMIALLFLGVWLVLQPTLRRGNYDLDVRVGSMEILLARMPETQPASYRVISPPEMAGIIIPPDELDDFLAARLDAWLARPSWERTLLGFFNITRWATFGWVVIGLAGQFAFFGRMLIQWVISERSRVSTVPEVFWWFSFAGGLFLFTYFVWRKDIVGVMGQATGVVIYARNLRLISKENRRIKAENGNA